MPEQSIVQTLAVCIPFFLIKDAQEAHLKRITYVNNDTAFVDYNNIKGYIYHDG